MPPLLVESSPLLCWFFYKVMAESIVLWFIVRAKYYWKNCSLIYCEKKILLNVWQIHQMSSSEQFSSGNEYVGGRCIICK
jgi:hypothetical protein